MFFKKIYYTKKIKLWVIIITPFFLLISTLVFSLTSKDILWPLFFFIFLFLQLLSFNYEIKKIFEILKFNDPEKNIKFIFSFTLKIIFLTKVHIESTKKQLNKG